MHSLLRILCAVHHGFNKNIHYWEHFTLHDKGIQTSSGRKKKNRYYRDYFKTFLLPAPCICLTLTTSIVLLQSLGLLKAFTRSMCSALAGLGHMSLKILPYATQHSVSLLLVWGNIFKNKEMQENNWKNFLRKKLASTGVTARNSLIVSMKKTSPKIGTRLDFRALEFIIEEKKPFKLH